MTFSGASRVSPRSCGLMTDRGSIAGSGIVDGGILHTQGLHYQKQRRKILRYGIELSESGLPFFARLPFLARPMVCCCKSLVVRPLEGRLFLIYGDPVYLCR